MATTNVPSRFRTPSALARDLALATVDLAALRARRGVEELDKEAQEAAVLLRDYYSRQLHAASTSGQISKDAVPDDSVREAIQQSLALLTETKPKLDEGDAQLLRELVRLLSPLAVTGRCEPEQARELHSALRELDAKEAAPSPRTDETNLWELLNAVS